MPQRLKRLVTVAENKARIALDATIEQARTDCSAFGDDLDFDAYVWDVTPWCPRPDNKSHGRARIYFTTHEGGSSKSLDGRTPLGEPLCALLKAIVRLKQEARPQTVDPLARIVNAARDLAEELVNRCHDPCLLLAEDFDAAERRVKERAAGTTAYRLGQALEEVARFIDMRGITPVRLDWRTTISRKTNSRDRTTIYATRAREEKIPEKEVLDALVEIWRIVESPNDVILMGAVTLLHCAPWRIVEVLRIVRDCEIEEQKQGQHGPVFDQHGAPIMRYGIRYWKEKSGEPDIKWIPTVMVEVAKQAIQRIKDATTGAHELACWLHDHPGRAWLPGASTDPTQEFTVKDVQGIFGFSRPPSALSWLNYNHVPLADRVVTLPRGGTRTVKVVRRADLEAALLNLMPKISDNVAEAPLHERMFVIFANQNHAKRGTNPCQLELANDQQVRDFLGGRREKGETVVHSAFQKLLKRPDLSAKTQQFRHWLNTLAQAGGLEQGLIARWSGRDDIQQNAEYDHLTPIELAEAMREPLEKGMAIGVLADIHTALPPVEKQAFRETVIATAHVTEIGFCIHDWNTTPCPEFGACSTCSSFVFTKGDAKHRERTEEMRRETAWIVQRLEAEIGEGTRGASNHYRTMVSKLESLDRILSFHGDPLIADGTLIQPNSSSPVRYELPEATA